MNTASDEAMGLLAGALEHMARHLHTGCPRAEQLSDLLLDRAVAHAGLPPELVVACRQLQAVIWQREAVAA